MIIIVLSFFITLISSKEILDLSKGTIEGHIIKKHSLAHHDVKLDCQRPSMPELSSDSSFSWVFYPSFYKHNEKKDTLSYPLCGATGQALCERRLILHNVNSTSSGLYKCSIVKSEGAGFTLTSTPVVAFQLEVGDHDPKFIEGPNSINVYEDVDATLSCKVQSDVPLTIKWFKRDNHPPSKVAVIHYNNNTYRPIMNVENHHEGNIYISDLIFKRVYKNDSGTYACSFLSPTGQILYREGSISVQHSFVVFSSLVQDRWEIFAAVLVVIVLVLITVACMVILYFKRAWEKSDDAPLNMRGKSKGVADYDGNETSEYEHVVL